MEAECRRAWPRVDQGDCHAARSAGRRSRFLFHSSRDTLSTDRNADPQQRTAGQWSFDGSGEHKPTTLVATPGRALTQLNVDLPGGYGLTFGASPTRPVRIDSGAELLLSWNNGIYTPDRHGTLATLDSSAPSYADCVASTRSPNG